MSVPAERSTPEVDVAIVTFRSAGEISKCLDSIQTSDRVKIGTVAVVDNASPDATLESVEASSTAVDVTASETNLGFATATNLAASKGGAEFLLVLNPDVTLERETLAGLTSTMRSQPQVGIAGCKLVLPDGSEDHAARRSFPTPLSALAHFAGFTRFDKAPARLRSYIAPDAAEGGPVDAVNGALMLIRRSWFEQVGGFDERYWMYMEDLDLCWRFREAGWLSWYEPSVSAVHIKGASSGRFRSLRLNWAFHRGMIRFYRDHLAPSHNPVYNITVYLGILIKFALSALRSKATRVVQRLSHPR